MVRIQAQGVRVPWTRGVDRRAEVGGAGSPVGVDHGVAQIEIVERKHYGHHPHGLELDEQQKFVDFFNGCRSPR